MLLVSDSMSSWARGETPQIWEWRPYIYHEHMSLLNTQVPTTAAARQTIRLLNPYQPTLRPPFWTIYRTPPKSAVGTLGAGARNRAGIRKLTVPDSITKLPSPLRLTHANSESPCWRDLITKKQPWSDTTLGIGALTIRGRHLRAVARGGESRSIPSLSINAAPLPVLSLPSLALPSLALPSPTIPSLTLPSLTLPPLRRPPLTLPPPALPRPPLPLSAPSTAGRTRRRERGRSRRRRRRRITCPAASRSSTSKPAATAR